VAGGDGTLAEAAAGLVGSALPMAIIPAGTGNILATNLNVPFGIKEATLAALQGTAAPFDVGRLDDGRIFLLAAGAGYDADLIRDADRELKRGLHRLHVPQPAGEARSLQRGAGRLAADPDQRPDRARL
jgi:diacylglycerol kinase family enzyme